MRQLIYLFFFQLLLLPGLQAQVTFDPMWDGDGVWKQSIGDSRCELYDMKLDASDRLVLVGVTDDPDESILNKRIVIIRLLPDGTLDLSFDGTTNANGMLFIDAPNVSDQAYGIEIQADGKLVIAGETDNKPVIFRLNSDGTFDNSFGTNGKVSFTLSNVFRFYNVAIQSDGRIVTTGIIGLNNSMEALVVRYNANGTLDLTFNFTGYSQFGTVQDMKIFYEQKILIQPDGKILVMGRQEKDPLSVADDGIVLRFLSTGPIDANFGFGGYYLLDVDATGETK